MNKKKRNALLLLTAFLGLLLLGVLTEQGRQKIRIVYISKSNEQSIDFWHSLTEGAAMAAEEYEIDYTFLAPLKETDYQKQNALIRETIRMKPDVIVLSPADSEKTLKAAKEIKKKGIPLVLVDSILKEEIADCIVATDNVKAGEELGNYMNTICKGEESVGLVSHVKDSSTAIDRETGIKNVIEAPVVDQVYGESDYEYSYEVTRQMLQAHPEITVIIATNEYATVGAATYIKATEQGGKVKILGFDNSVKELQMLEAGIIDGIVVQRAFDMGYLGIQAATSIAQGKQVEKRIHSGFRLITKESMYTEENQKLLFPIWMD